MHAQELLVEQGSEGQAVEGLHTGVIHPLRVFDFTWRNMETLYHSRGAAGVQPDRFLTRLNAALLITTHH